MCMQCVANGTVYVGGAIGALQVLRVRASRRRATMPAGAPPPAEPEKPAPSVDALAG